MARIVIADDNKELVSMISEFLKMQPNIEVVKSFTGDLDNIIGLPVSDLRKDLIELGIKL